MKEKYPLFRIQKFIFKTQLWVLGLFSFSIFYSLYESKPLEVLTQQISLRAPASIAVEEPHSTDVLKLDCGMPTTLKANSYQVRIESFFCEKNFKKLSVKNKSTGSDASIFKRSPATFTTDYIHLQKGENLISFSYKKESEEVTREIILIRN